jgi:hypothetical protein
VSDSFTNSLNSIKQAFYTQRYPDSGSYPLWMIEGLQDQPKKSSDLLQLAWVRLRGNAHADPSVADVSLADADFLIDDLVGVYGGDELDGDEARAIRYMIRRIRKHHGALRAMGESMGEP